VRVVLDTNVFVAALLGPHGPSREVVRACLQGRLTPLMGAALFAEYESLLHRPGLFEGCVLDSAEREALFDALASISLWTPIYFTWRPNLRDEGDNHVIELAVAGGAAAIVTNNQRHFAGAELHFSSVRVLTPKILLKEYPECRP
jgi:putative PIN family toxin of toxin-antitoxin system